MSVAFNKAKDKAGDSLNYLANKCTDYTSSQACQAMWDLQGDIPYHDRNSRARLGQFMATIGFASMFTNILKTLKDVNGFRELENTALLVICMNFTFRDSLNDLKKDLVEQGAIDVLLSHLDSFKYTELSGNELVQSIDILSVLLNCVDHPDNDVRNAYRESNAVPILTKYLKSTNSILAIKSLSILAYIVDDSEREVISNTEDCIIHMVDMLQEAVQADNGKVFRMISGRSYTTGIYGLIGTMNRLATNEANQNKIVQHGGIPIMIKLISRQNLTDEILQYAIETLWKIAATDRHRKDIMTTLRETDTTKVIQEYQKSTNTALMIASAALLEQLDLVGSGISMPANRSSAKAIDSTDDGIAMMDSSANRSSSTAARHGQMNSDPEEGSRHTQGIYTGQREESSELESDIWSQNTAIVDHTGGEIVIGKTNARLLIPEGALPQGTHQEITVVLHWNNVPSLVQGSNFQIGPTLQCKPDGLKFSSPVTIYLPHSGNNITTSNIKIFTKGSPEGENKWHVLYDGSDEQQSGGNLSVGKKVIGFRVHHFTWYAPLIEFFFGTTINMEMLTYQIPSTLSRSTDVAYLRLHAVRQDQREMVITEETRHNSGSCALATPFDLEVNGRTKVRFVVKNIDTMAGAWDPQMAEKDIEFALLQAGGLRSRCEIMYTKMTQQVMTLAGVINAFQDPREVINDVNFSSSMIKAPGNVSIVVRDDERGHHNPRNDPHARIYRILTDRRLEMVAGCIVPTWRQVARLLGYTDNQCGIWQGDHIATSYHPPLFMLKDWRQHRGQDIDTFADALRESGYVNLAEEVLNWE